MSDYTELKRLAEAATAGPWRECGHDWDGCPCNLVWSIPADEVVAAAYAPIPDDEMNCSTASGRRADAAFIAAANPAAVKGLIATIRDLAETVACQHGMRKNGEWDWKAAIELVQSTRPKGDDDE